MITTSSLGTTAAVLPLRPCDSCGADRPAAICPTHRICQACGTVRIASREETA